MHYRALKNIQFTGEETSDDLKIHLRQVCNDLYLTQEENRENLLKNMELLDELRVRNDELELLRQNQEQIINEQTEELKSINSALSEEIEVRKGAEKVKEELIDELKEALSRVKQLGGLLPICSSCKKIRDDQGYWNKIETYIADHSEADFTHGICPDCTKRIYPELTKTIGDKLK